ncbi:NucA/NucB deoxyribonuclease domain-containing protein [Streptomyces sp. NPDC016626]|uniref:NucA/NucB deoxyribonuclease domain-containing protein n=1 Tax=Streptomyces sp. NPDC016626 TaxID=3364968 RepID=UPI0036F8FAFB
MKFRRLSRAAAATSVLSLLTVVLTAADSGAEPASAPDDSQMLFVDAATVPADQLEQLDQPQPLADYARARNSRAAIATEAAAPADEADLRTECEAQAEKAKTAQGWIKSRFESCQKRPYDLVLRNKEGTEAIGRLWFDMWTLGFAYDGTRRVDYTTSIENIRVQSVGTEDATKWRVGQHFRETINASNSDPNPQLTLPQTTSRDELLGVWDTSPLWTLTYTSPDQGALYSSGNQQRVAATVLMDVTADSPNASSYSEVDAYRSSVRFDYAGPVAGKYKGAVFTEARVELSFSQSDPAVDESALHIYDAQHNPERTFPSWPAKTVPGETEPLHRLVDAEEQQKNRNTSIATCNNVWGDYSGTPLQCDEYPFASTKEGANKGDNRYSVRLIEGSDNEEGGRRLNSMYTLNRMLDDDPFYVKITR